MGWIIDRIHCLLGRHFALTTETVTRTGSIANNDLVKTREISVDCGKCGRHLAGYVPVR